MSFDFDMACGGAKVGDRVLEWEVGGIQPSSLFSVVLTFINQLPEIFPGRGRSEGYREAFQVGKHENQAAEDTSYG